MCAPARGGSTVLDAVVVRALRMPLLVIAQIPHLNVVFLKVGGFGRQVDGQIGLVHFVVLLQLAQADTAQINVVVVVDRKEMFVAQGGVVVGNRVAELGLVLAVEHQRDAELRGHLGRQLLLAQNEGWNGGTGSPSQGGSAGGGSCRWAYTGSCQSPRGSTPACSPSPRACRCAGPR